MTDIDRMKRIERLVHEEFPGCSVMFDEPKLPILRWLIKAPDGTIITHVHPDMDPGEIDVKQDSELRRYIFSLLNRADPLK